MTTKAIVLGIALVTMMVVSGIFSASPSQAQTAQPIVDGALVKTADNPDIYIVKHINGKKFRRLILNPTIFESYGHLSWEDVLTVSQATMNMYTVSDLVREVYPDGSLVPPGDVYKLYPQGDTGIKRLLRITQQEFESRFDKDSIYNINHLEAGPTFYARGADITSADLATIAPIIPTPVLPPTTPDPVTPTTPSSDSDGSEGELTVRTNNVDLASELTQGRTESVLAADLEAEGSDVELKRVDIHFVAEGYGKDVDVEGSVACTSSSDTSCETKEERPWKTFDKVQLMIDGEVIATKSRLDSDDFRMVTGSGNMASSYRLRFDGLDEVIAEDEEVKIEVTVRTLGSLRDNRVEHRWALAFADSSIRGWDEAGLNKFVGNGIIERAGNASDGVLSTSGTARTFTVIEEEPGLSVTKYDDDDIEKIARVSDSSGTDDIELLTVEVSNGEDDPDSTLNEMTFEIASTSDWSDDQEIDNFFTGASLYEGNKELDSVDIGSASAAGVITVVFDDLDLGFGSEEDMMLTLKVDVTRLNSANEGHNAVATLAGYEYEYGADEVVVSKTGLTVSGDTIRFFATSPIVTVSGTPSLTLNDDGNRGTAEFEVRVEAVGGDVYLADKCGPDNAGFEFEVSADTNDITDALCIIQSTSNVDKVEDSRTGAGGDARVYMISEGNTATFEFEMVVTATTAGYKHVTLSAINWRSDNESDSDDFGSSTELDLTELEIETPSRYLSVPPSA